MLNLKLILKINKNYINHYKILISNVFNVLMDIMLMQMYNKPKINLLVLIVKKEQQLKII